MSASEQKNALPKCITGFNPYGLCSCCRSDGKQCCLQCEEKDDCNIVCGWLNKKGADVCGT